MAETWTHTFFCLADKDEDHVPPPERSLALQTIGLGRKRITFPDKNGTHEDLCETLHSFYPPLKDAGGFQILRGFRSKALQSIPIPTSGYSVKFLRTESGLNQAVAYVRPLQTSIPMIELQDSDKVEAVAMEKCKTCETEIPLQDLARHIQCCTRTQPVSSFTLEVPSSPAEDVIVLETVNEPVAGPSGYPSQSLIPASTSTVVLSEPAVPTYRDYVDLICPDVWSDSDNEDLNRAIEESLKDHPCTNLQDILLSLRKDINTDEVLRFNINRKNVWDGTIRGMRRPNFSVKKRIDIKFTDDDGNSEGAVDMGGPMREFFRLVLQHIKLGPMFTGPENERVLCCHAPSLRDNSYFYAGQLIAMSILHGGPSPNFFSPVLYQAVVAGADGVQADIGDIHDPETESYLLEILGAQCKEDIDRAVEKCANLLSLAGCLRTITLVNKNEVVQDVINWIVLQRTRAQFERFQEGLRSGGLLDAVQSHPTTFKQVFLKCDKLTAETLEQLFKEERSEYGSNKYDQESEAVCHWRDYLLETEMGITDVTLEEILVFATGSDSVPTLGFDPQPTVQFLYDSSRYPQANTCANILKIPCKASYDDFKCDMDFGIKNSPGFGVA
ncbi:G2/M phase-specific E3 ubiquitin-protein ligase-like isoform X2 [Paramormyrops kingsleyae]|uniref:G2/M phase-specific E3 ubiquitin-protein ligase-like isoform X2 n=1 Tax=Paramormyrops kingsleyae TaxID=1676925 RepID=UPI003B96A398